MYLFFDNSKLTSWTHQLGNSTATTTILATISEHLTLFMTKGHSMPYVWIPTMQMRKENNTLIIWKCFFLARAPGSWLRHAIGQGMKSGNISMKVCMLDLYFFQENYIYISCTNSLFELKNFVMYLIPDLLFLIWQPGSGVYFQRFFNRLLQSQLV